MVCSTIVARSLKKGLKAESWEDTLLTIRIQSYKVLLSPREQLHHAIQIGRSLYVQYPMVYQKPLYAIERSLYIHWQRKFNPFWVPLKGIPNNPNPTNVDLFNNIFRSRGNIFWPITYSLVRQSMMGLNLSLRIF